ncbi:MAG TPA: hypothetical protein VJ821_07895 [Anaerolineales bacterium]|nr:hypothetical protein [Anaerolineales bacterium]
MKINVPQLRTLSLRFLSDPKIIRWGKRILFATGMLLFTSVQLTMVVLPIMSRTAPVETDDAYTYITKAAQMQDCFLQNCPALNDLRQQLLTPSEKPNVTWIRYREYVRAFSIYHPLHSLILVSLHTAGLPWEVSYNIVEIVGSLFLSLAISYWLYRLFGSGPAGIALLLLAFTPFPGQGLHYVVPSNLAMGIGMLTWGSLLKRDRISRWIVIGSTVILVLMHPVGRLYALLGILLFIFLNLKQMKRTDWQMIGLSVFMIMMAFILPLIISRPELSFPADPPPPDWNTWSGYYNNIREAASFVSSWMRLYGGFLMAVLLIFVGLVSLSPFEQRARVLSMAVLLGGLLGASLFQVLPRYPAEAFSRIWIPFAIFLTGLIGHGIWRWAAAVVHWTRQAVENGVQDFRDEGWILSMPGWASVFLLVFGLVLARNSVNHVLEGQRILRETLTITTDSQDSHLDAEQPSMLLKAGCEDILYMFEVPMHLYFAHGALVCGATYHPALDGTPEENHWIQDNPNLGYVVTWNPTIQAAVTTGGSPLALETGDLIEFHVPEGWGSQVVYIYLENSGGNTRLNIFPLDVETEGKPKSVERISIPGNWSGWQAIDITAEELAHGFSLDAAQVSNAIYVRGIKSDPGSLRNWPWDQGVTLFHRRSGSDAEATEINFHTDGLIPYSDWSLTVVDDRGDTVLLKINH